MGVKKIIIMKYEDDETGEVYQMEFDTIESGFEYNGIKIAEITKHGEVISYPEAGILILCALYHTPSENVISGEWVSKTYEMGQRKYLDQKGDKFYTIEDGTPKLSYEDDGGFFSMKRSLARFTSLLISRRTSRIGGSVRISSNW